MQAQQSTSDVCITVMSEIHHDWYSAQSERNEEGEVNRQGGLKANNMEYLQGVKIHQIKVLKAQKERMVFGTVQLF